MNWKKSNQLIWLDIYKSEKSVRGKTSVGIILFSIKFSFPFVQISAYYVNGIVMRVCVSVSVYENCDYIEPVQNRCIWCLLVLSNRQNKKRNFFSTLFEKRAVKWEIIELRKKKQNISADMKSAIFCVCIGASVWMLPFSAYTQSTSFTLHAWLYIV